MAEKKASSISRTRNFACVCYPDSVPENWLRIIDDWHVPCFVSPLHDEDVNPDGERKQPHYHVMLMFENVKTDEQARELFHQINGKGCERIKATRAYARYLCHLDNPEKHLYSPTQVYRFGGADYEEIIQSAADQVDAVRQMQQLVDDNDIISYFDFSNFIELRYPELFRVLVLGHTFHIKEYIKSRFWRLYEYDKED